MSTVVLRDAQVLTSQPLWGVTRAAETTCFQFGAQRSVPSRTGSPRSVGDYALHVQCGYKLVAAGALVDDVREFVTRAGPLVVSRVVEPTPGNLVLTFDPQTHLTITADISAADEQWRLFQPSSSAKHLVFTNGRFQ